MAPDTTLINQNSKTVGVRVNIKDTTVLQRNYHCEHYIHKYIISYHLMHWLSGICFLNDPTGENLAKNVSGKCPTASFKLIDGSVQKRINSRGPYYWHGLTLIAARMDKWIHYDKMWDEVIYPFPNFNGRTTDVWKWISNFIPQFPGHLITYPCWDLS